MRRKASITSSTSTSGAEAPAVMPTALASFSQSGFKFAAVGDEITRNADFGADFAQPVRIGTIGGPHHQNDVHELAEVPYRRLAVLCRIADIPDVRALNIRKTLLEGGNDVLGVVHAERGLGDVGHRRVRGQRQGRDIVDVLDQQHRAGNLPHGSLDLGVAGMADQDQRPALRHVALALVVDLGHQRAGGIEDRQAARCGFLLHAPRHAVGAEYGDGVRRHFRQVLDEDGAFVLQAFDHVFVVHDLMAHIDRRAILLERALDDLDRAHDACAKPAGLRKIHFHGTPVTQVAPNSFLHLRLRRDICNIRTMPVSASVCSQAHGGTGLCVKKRSARKAGSQNGKPKGVSSRYYNTVFCQTAAE